MGSNDITQHPLFLTSVPLGEHSALAETFPRTPVLRFAISPERVSASEEQHMKVVFSLFLLLVLLPFSLACNPPSDTSAATKAIASPAFDAAEIQQDIKTGKLKFEIRGLANEGQDKTYGKSFEHSAIVIPVGDSKYSKGDYLLFCSIKRLSGGNPEEPRKADVFTAVFIHNGMGRLTESGGIKSKGETWEAEKIEVRPEVVFIGTPIVRTAVQE
jgi:hypothetical protein